MGMHLTNNCGVNFCCYVENVRGWRRGTRDPVSVVGKAGNIWCPFVPFEGKEVWCFLCFFSQKSAEMIEFFKKSCVIHDKNLHILHYCTYERHIFQWFWNMTIHNSAAIFFGIRIPLWHPQCSKPPTAFQVDRAPGRAFGKSMERKAWQPVASGFCEWSWENHPGVDGWTAGRVHLQPSHIFKLKGRKMIWSQAPGNYVAKCESSGM